MTLSSTEAEYLALLEVCMEIMFVKQIMELLQLEMTKPIVVNVDNVGAIYLATNASSSGRTRHIDSHYHYVREYVSAGVVEIVFVKSQNNVANLFTKNLSKESFSGHAGVFVDDMEEFMTEKK